MRKIGLWLMSTVTAVVMLFGYHTSTSGPQGSQTVSTAPLSPGSPAHQQGPAHGHTAGSGAGAGGTGGAGGNGGTGSATRSAAPRVVTGPVAQTQWGPVQVQIKVVSGKITQVGVPQYPHGSGTDQQINAYALPRLVQETISAQSAQIQMISGATITSGGYVQSLQGAIDQAGL